ncbi:TlpA family protein disulfide reductase [Pedobacter sp.]
MKLKHIITIALAIFFFYSKAQVKPLKIGDTVPDLVLEKMLNHKDGSGKLSDFRGKAIIIDQWYIGCAPCVSAMPKLDSLQKIFSKELQILPVTFEKINDVKEFWRTNIIAKEISFVQVVADTLLKKYFPAIKYPQQVWIDKHRKVVAITDGNSTNAQNIRKLINDERLSLDTKMDELNTDIRRAVNPDILVRYEQNKHKILFYSYFSKYRKEFSAMAMSKVDSVNKIVRVFNNNNSLFGLYDFAYSNNSWEMRHMPTRFVRKDSCPVKGEVETVADTVFQFCYDLMYPGSTTKGFSKFMVADLDKFFNIKSREELVDIVCYAISPNGHGDRYTKTYRIDQKKGYMVSLYKAKKIIANDAIPMFLELNINGTSENPILLEVDRSKKINFELNWNLSNLDIMNQELATFDLKIEKVIRKRKVIVLEDIEKGNL